MTWQETFYSCPLMELYVSLCCTITKRTQFWSNPFQMSTIAAFSQIWRYSRHWKQRDTSRIWTWWITGDKVCRKNSHHKGMWFTACGATQSLCQRCRACNPQDFPLQLWDKLAPQVQDTLNLLRSPSINSNILAYKALNGPYNWDRHPLAPPGCKAITYKAPAVRGSWASQGTDAWYLWPSADE